jgi:tetratricopeptide (TPR) repeat protein
MRTALTLLAIALCLFLIQASARFGLSRMFSRYALVANSIPAANQAVNLSPSDPEAHRTRAAVLNQHQMPAEAAKSLESAVALRYRDDYLWIELGNTREELGDSAGAFTAMDEAVRWAPYYAHTHWQRGNLLLRMGRPNEAFAALRQAAAANPRYAPNLIDLAWGVSRNDLKTTEALLGITNDSERLAFIRFLARKGKGKEVQDEIFSLNSPLSKDNANELIHLLFDSKAFREAFELWRHPKSCQGCLFNGSFEEPLVFDAPTFGWIIAPDQRNRFAIDVSEKSAGEKSLQIKLDGAWTPQTSLLSQTVVADPNKSYRLSFAVKTKHLVTGGPPVITVYDANNDRVLAKSENLPTGTTSWQRMSVTFTTLPTSQATVIRLQRSNCDSSPCPIFGTLWLDEFYIAQTDAVTKR